MMSSHRPTTGVVPPKGLYLVLWLDPVKMVQHFDNPILHAAVGQLSPGKYVAYVATNTDFPMPDRPWHRCFVRLAGLGMPKDEPEQFITSDMSQTLSAYQAFSVRELLPAYVGLHNSNPPAKIEPVALASEVAPDTVVEADGVVKVEDWLKTTDHSQEPLEELATDNDISSQVSGDDTPDSLSDDDVSPSTPYSDDDASSMDTVDLLFESLFVPDFSHIDVDIIPLVDFSFDLTEVKEFLDPRGFLEEVEAMAEYQGPRSCVFGSARKLVQEAQEIVSPSSGSPDSLTAVSPADPVAVLPRNSVVVFAGHGNPTTPSEQVPSSTHSTWLEVGREEDVI
ncbi:predicted protein [Postia placenta Mad-698-R]|uniref:Uncharacterized protein n=1 Tax=Postia placenta MAD-698-R-SB12 TaxID=670580 RepID=A0A1X6N4K3_9APHY|nr:hypothetical protein POSPLADRAFT_1140290 [Postia placenta MAD-698-R-SB12]EED80628.1 predicted protein [Postia placenta Mad-698-R]OSX63382.1 hypothetical protein POSPLADRAFT_1140290 [Postia placenta MAD-698-R-SB12]